MRVIEWKRNRWEEVVFVGLDSRTRVKVLEVCDGREVRWAFGLLWRFRVWVFDWVEGGGRDL